MKPEFNETFKAALEENYPDTKIFNKTAVGDIFRSMIEWIHETISAGTVAKWIEYYNDNLAKMDNRYPDLQLMNLIIKNDLSLEDMNRLFRYLITYKYSDQVFWKEGVKDQGFDDLQRSDGSFSQYANSVGPQKNIRFEKRDENKWVYQPIDMQIIRQIAERRRAPDWDRSYRLFPVTRFISKFSNDPSLLGDVTLRCIGTINYPDTLGYENEHTEILFADVFTSSIRIIIRDQIIPGTVTVKYPIWAFRLRLSELETGTRYEGDSYYLFDLDASKTDPNLVESSSNYDETTGNLIITGKYKEDGETRTMIITLRPERIIEQ